MLSLDDMERMVFQEDYAPGMSVTGEAIERENLVKNPRLAVFTTGWFNVNGSNFGRVVIGDLPGFTHAAKLDVTTNNERIEYQDAEPVVPDKTYIASLYVKAAVGTTIGIEPWGEGGATEIPGSNITHDGTGKWVRVSTVIKAINNSFLFKFRNLTNVPSTIMFTGLMIELGSVLKPYFDGDTPGTDYRWSGTPHNSKSQLLDVNARDFAYLERAYWAKRSGLTPANEYSVNDHMFAALRAEGRTGTIGDMLFQRYGGNEYNYYKNLLGL